MCNVKEKDMLELISCSRLIDGRDGVLSLRDLTNVRWK